MGEIDEFDVDSLLFGHRLTGITRATKHAAISRMLQRGDEPEVIASHFGISVYAVKKTALRAKQRGERVAA